MSQSCTRIQTHDDGKSGNCLLSSSLHPDFPSLTLLNWKNGSLLCFNSLFGSSSRLSTRVPLDLDYVFLVSADPG
ncbi:hypothetical protein V6N13_043608 [Hibiscus sabdariffa]|uniref:Uncharacterized protein n=1 Tax=Hibiscus sabdariffa TaxID=183260 RepID=A0ABR2RGC1_9ROSI